VKAKLKQSEIFLLVKKRLAGKRGIGLVESQAFVSG
jgi:hypothetical protein